uniref:Uncharacterized protein n=1 Tax=Glossina austeni TaxID=7395 RepID=A0A1A9UPQ1_GLOAU
MSNLKNTSTTVVAISIEAYANKVTSTTDRILKTLEPTIRSQSNSFIIIIDRRFQQRKIEPPSPEKIDHVAIKRARYSARTKLKQNYCDPYKMNKQLKRSLLSLKAWECKSLENYHYTQVHCKIEQKRKVRQGALCFETGIVIILGVLSRSFLRAIQYYNISGIFDNSSLSQLILDTPKYQMLLKFMFHFLECIKIVLLK